MKKKYIIIVSSIVLVWVGIIGVVAFINKETKEDVNVTSVERYIVPEQKKIIVSGTVVPNESKIYYKDVSKGKDITINVTDGSSVNEGDLLITYKNDEIPAQIIELNDQIDDLKNQKNNLEKEVVNSKVETTNQIGVLESQKNQLEEEVKVEPENKEKIASIEEIDKQIEAFKAQSEKTESQEASNSLQQQINKISKQIETLKGKEVFNVYAPFAGKVYINNNSDSEETQELLKIRTESFHVEAQIGEKDFSRVKADLEAEVVILPIDKTVLGKVTSISDEPEKQISGGDIDGGVAVSNYPINISLNEQVDIVNGYQVQATVKPSQQEVKVPKDSIIKEEDSNYVYIIIENILKKQVVEIKVEKEQYVIIKAGLKEKDEIVKTPTLDMKEGQQIE